MEKGDATQKNQESETPSTRLEENHKEQGTLWGKIKKGTESRSFCHFLYKPVCQNHLKASVCWPVGMGQPGRKKRHGR